MSEIEKLQYPIGKFKFDSNVTERKRDQWIVDYAAIPDELESAVADLTDNQLDTQYRPEGWTVRQVVHHLTDSHIYGYIRFKLVLTEDNPEVHVADQDAWTERAESRTAPIETSVQLFRFLHERWVILLRTLSPEDFQRTCWHPWWDTVSLDFLVQNYPWHGRHHVAQITSLRERMRW